MHEKSTPFLTDGEATDLFVNIFTDIRNAKLYVFIYNDTTTRQIQVRMYTGTFNYIVTVAVIISLMPH